MERLCVFSGSSPGAHSDYLRAAQELGRALADQDVALVYGGASVGLMAALADGFVALPGGMGTLEELFEVYTWTQLGLHSKPLGLLDVRGYYDKLVAFLDHTVEERFMTVEHREMLVVEERAEALLEAFRRWRAPVRAKWIDRAQT